MSLNLLEKVGGWFTNVPLREVLGFLVFFKLPWPSKTSLLDSEAKKGDFFRIGLVQKNSRRNILVLANVTWLSTM